VYRVLVRIREGKGHYLKDPGIPRKWKTNIKMGLWEVGGCGLDWFCSTVITRLCKPSNSLEVPVNLWMFVDWLSCLRKMAAWR